MSQSLVNAALEDVCAQAQVVEHEARKLVVLCRLHRAGRRTEIPTGETERRARAGRVTPIR